MALPNIFNATVANTLTERLQRLSEKSQPQWGKMNAPQVLAHLNVMFELGLEQKHQRPNAFIRFMLKTFVKKKIINDVPYKQNSMTAPEMVITRQPDFQLEKNRVLNYLTTVGQKGEKFFEQREHPSFGQLTAAQWSNLFYKHIDHHLKQFGV